MKLAKKYSKSILYAFLIAVMAVSVTGCGNSEKEKVVLSIWASPQDNELTQMYVDSFKEYYKDEADFEITICEENEGTCKDTVLLCPEAAADIFTFADDQFEELYNSGVLLAVTENLDDVVAASGGPDSSCIYAASKNQILYAYPATASNGYFLYYNSDYYTEEQASTLDGLLQGAIDNDKKVAMEFTSGWYLYGFFEGAGLHVKLDDSGRYDNCDWNSTSGKYTGVDVTRSLLELSQNSGFVNLGNDDLVEGVISGDVIACISGTWNSSVIEDAYGKGYMASMLPTYTVNGEQLQIHSVAGYKLVGVNSHSNEPVWAQRFAAWITNEENQLLRFEMRGEGPTNVNAANSEKVKSNPAIAALSKQSAYGHIQRVSPDYWSETYRFSNIIMSGNIEEKDMQALLDELVNNIGGDN